jgi:hypothetical protein
LPVHLITRFILFRRFTQRFDQCTNGGDPLCAQTADLFEHSFVAGEAGSFRRNTLVIVGQFCQLYSQRLRALV